VAGRPVDASIDVYALGESLGTHVFHASTAQGGHARGLQPLRGERHRAFLQCRLLPRTKRAAPGTGFVDRRCLA
jgi:hypothetical protein